MLTLCCQGPRRTSRPCFTGPPLARSFPFSAAYKLCPSAQQVTGQPSLTFSDSNTKKHRQSQKVSACEVSRTSNMAASSDNQTKREGLFVNSTLRALQPTSCSRSMDSKSYQWRLRGSLLLCDWLREQCTSSVSSYGKLEPADLANS
jgi:hypothetical protein